ncbi:MAG: glycosyltransferase family 4 protein [Helicobacteraceae bacterium]|jgi:glycosyltransferase involved in cell wall biosynthesis|nr:glycosyltransferase family 4 protein [Helicobacteraceae bacterium]
MNILFALSKRNWGGINTWAKSVINHLARVGHNVTLVTSKNSPDLGVSVEQKRINYGFDFNPVTQFLFFRLCKARKIDLVVANIDKDMLAVGPACRALGIPLLRRIGGDMDIDPSKTKSRLIHQWFVKYGICTSAEVIDESRRRNPWLKTPVKVIYSGVKEEKYTQAEIDALKDKLGVKKDDLTLGVTARLVKGKRIDFVIDVLSQLLIKRENIKLIIAGSGGEESALKAQVEALKLGEKVIFAGYAKEPLLFAALYDIGYLISSADSFPFTIIEYMAAGKPVIAANIGGIPEGITDGYNGYLVEPNDEKAVYEITERLLDDPVLRKRIGDNAYKRFLERHTQERMVKNTEAYFVEIAKR